MIGVNPRDLMNARDQNLKNQEAQTAEDAAKAITSAKAKRRATRKNKPMAMDYDEHNDDDDDDFNTKTRQ